MISPFGVRASQAEAAAHGALALHPPRQLGSARAGLNVTQLRRREPGGRLPELANVSPRPETSASRAPPPHRLSISAAVRALEHPGEPGDARQLAERRLLDPRRVAQLRGRV